ncbi:regulator [Rhodopila globiformis]|uniref:Regulator n=1 Tax=Rhodopila globiformis TaxID=1071 RepID=A0A2S6NMH9_RHOGL|nr:regulator [Rhodopila globiformis]PPQ37204.1 regulator [Rhodopila globiformis]
MSGNTATGFRPKLWVPGDWNALFGFGTNILVNILVLTGLLRFVLKMPDALVFGRILPALGLMLFLSTGYYAFLAWNLARRTGRSDVCALPSGISVPHMFVVTFVVMLPIKLATNDPVQAWEAGLTWVFVQSFVLMFGGLVGPYLRAITPRAALLGSLAGISITFISMSPAAQVFNTPIIGVVCFAVILANWFGGVRYFGGVPGGLVAIALGTLIAWVSTAFGLGYGDLSVGKLVTSVANFGFSVPLPAFHYTFDGFRYLGIILVTAIPFGIYDLIEALDNVESAAAAGDSFATIRVLSADGAISLVGCLMGNPFINAVYIGHPGWKAMGGRIGYSAMTGIIVLVLTWFGIIAVISALIPVVAILPILLYIGMLIGSQAFQESPHRHAPAIVLALLPQLAAWGKTQVDNALAAAGTNAAAVGVGKLASVGVLYDGLATLGGGATLAGIILGAMTVFIIDRAFEKAAAFALAGTILSFFGFIHGAEGIGINSAPTVSVSYLGVAGILFYCARYAQFHPVVAEVHGATAEAD